MVLKTLSRSVVCVLLFILATISVHAQDSPAGVKAKFLADPPIVEVKDKFFKPYGRGFKISTAIYWGGTSLDLISSRGLRELNPVLRGSDGKISYGKAVAWSVAGYALTLPLEKKYPRAASWIRIAVGVGRSLLAIRNFNQ